MVEVVSHAKVADEYDVALKRPQNSPSVTPSPTDLTNLSQKRASEKILSPVNGPDVRLEIKKLEHISGFLYKLVDRQSGEILRQWPTEEMIEMRQYLAEQKIQLLDEKI